MNSPTSTEEFFPRTELVLVRPDVTRGELESASRVAQEKNLRALCVNSSRVAAAFAQLEESDVKVISTIGFPIGAADSDVKRYEVEAAIDNGAQEFELVLNLGQIKDREEDFLLRELRDVVDVAEERPVSVLLPTKFLSPEEQIFVCQIALESGAKFLNAGNADVETIKFLHETLGGKFNLKISGEMSDAETARALIRVGATHFAVSHVP